jgi:preprotein translocase subunit YajC
MLNKSELYGVIVTYVCVIMPYLGDVMQVSNLVLLIIAFLIILMVLSFFYVYMPSKKRSSQSKEEDVDDVPGERIPTFNELHTIIKTRDTTTKALSKAVEQTLRYYGTIKPKNGIAPSQDFKHYGDMMFLVAKHPNTTKDIVLKFNKGLTRKNPSYQREIDEMLNRGLTARG